MVFTWVGAGESRGGVEVVRSGSSERSVEDGHRSSMVEDRSVSADLNMRVVANTAVGDFRVDEGGEEHRWGASNSRRDRDSGGRDFR